MHLPTRFLKQHSLIIGILLMFILTWPIDLAHSQILPFRVPFAVNILLGYGFILASLIMTGLTRGRHEVLALLKRFLIWRVGWKWYLVALFLLPSISLLAVLINSAITGSLPDFSTAYAVKLFGEQANLTLLILPFFLFDAITNGEEMGWRGYVLPRLQERHSALTASLILGVVWWLWHLPKFLAPDNTASFALYLLEMLPKAVLYTWLYDHTRGSLLLVTLFHASGNTAGMFLPVANTGTGHAMNSLILSIGLLASVAVGIVLSSPPAWLKKKGAPAAK